MMSYDEPDPEAHRRILPSDYKYLPDRTPKIPLSRFFQPDIVEVKPTREELIAKTRKYYRDPK